MIRFLIAVLFLIPICASAVAGMPESFNFSGRLTDSTNTAVENNVDLTFQIFDPSGACLLYEETGSVNTSTTAGRFSVSVGSSVGAAKRQAGVDPGLSMNAIFRNGATITGAGGCSYIASPGDERQLKVTITKIGSTTMSEVFASHAIRSVPFAMLAESANDLQGKTPGNFVQVNTSGTEVLNQNNVETIFDNANYTKLTALLAGTSSLYNKPASNGTSVLPNIAIVSTPAAGQVWYDAGSIKYYDGTATQVLSTGGTQTNITATGTITGATIVGTNGTITNFGSRKIQLFDADSSNWVTLQTPSVVTADYTLTLPPDDGTSNQVLTTNGSGVLTWTTPAAGSVTGVTATAPLASTGGATPDISIPKATALADGYLSATDFGIFYNKLGKALTSGNIWVGGAGGNASEVTMSGDATINNTGVLTISQVNLSDLKSSVDSSALFATTCTANQSLFWSAPTGQFLCGNIDNLDGSKITVGTVNIARMPAFAGGDVTSAAGSGVLTLGNTTVANGTYGSASKATAFAVDAKGRLTAASETPIAIDPEQIVSAATKYFTYKPNNIACADQNLLKWDGATSRWICGTPPAGDGGITSFNTLTGLSQTLANGTTGTAPGWNSTGTTHTLNIPMASGTGVTGGLINKTDYDSFASKQSTTLANGNIWVGGAGGTATSVSVGGDASLSNTGTLTLGTSGVAAGTYTSVTVNAKGLVTNASSPTTLSGYGITDAQSSTLTNGKIWIGSGLNVASANSLSGDATLDSAGTVTLATSGVIANAYGSASKSTAFTVDVKGRLTAASETAIAIDPEQIVSAATKYFTYKPNNIACADQNLLKWDGATSRWICGTPPAGDGGITSFNGLGGLTQTLATGTSGSAPGWNSTGTSHTLNIPMASGSGVTAGLINKTDYDAFTAKQSTALANGKIWVGNGGVATQATPSGDVTMDSAGSFTINNAVTSGTYTKVTVNTKGLITTGANPTTLSGYGITDAISTFNGISGAAQTLGTGTSGTAPSWNSTGTSHTLNIPMAASAGTTAGLISKGDYDSFAGKQSSLGFIPVNISGDTMTGALNITDSVATATQTLMRLTQPNASSFTRTRMVLGRVASTDESAVLTYKNDPTPGLRYLSFSHFNGPESLVIRNDGKVGIGTTSPATMLEVAGTIRVGDGGETCGASYTGGIRYIGGSLQFCNGTTWSTLGIAGSGITALTNDVTATGTGSVAATISADAVTFAKMQNINTAKIIGRTTAAVGDPEEIGVSSNLTLSAATLDVGSNVPLKNAANTFAVGGQIITNDAIGTKPLVIRGFAGQTAPLQEWQNGGSTVLYGLSITGVPVATTDLTSKAYVDGTVGNYLLKSGGMMTGAINMNSNAINGVMDPTAAQDATTKNYADTKLRGLNLPGPTGLDTGKTLTYNGADWSYTAFPADTGITQLTGDVTTTAGSGAKAATIAASAVTFSKVQNIATNRLLGRSTASAGIIEEIILGTGLSYTGTTLNVTEADPSVKAFAKATLPTCLAGQVLKGDGTALSCVTDANSGGDFKADGTVSMTGPLVLSQTFSTCTAGLEGRIISQSGILYICKGALGWSKVIDEILPTGSTFVGNASGVANAVMLNGDVASVTGTGGVTLAANVAKRDVAGTWSANQNFNASAQIGTPLVATAVNNYSSSQLGFVGTYYNGGTSINDTWTVSNVVAATGTSPATTLNISHTGSAGTATMKVNANLDANQAFTTLTDAASITWSMSGLVNNATVTLAGVARTLVFSNLQSGMSGTIIVKQDAIGGRTITTLPTACGSNKVINGGAGALILSSAAGAVDILTFVYDGSACYWTYGGNYN